MPLSHEHVGSRILTEQNYFALFAMRYPVTVKSLSEALIFASINPQYDNRFFMELPVQYMKTTSAEHWQNIGRTWAEHAQNMRRTCAEHAQNMFLPCSAHVLHL